MVRTIDTNTFLRQKLRNNQTLRKENESVCQSVVILLIYSLRYKLLDWYLTKSKSQGFACSSNILINHNRFALVKTISKHFENSLSGCAKKLQFYPIELYLISFLVQINDVVKVIFSQISTFLSKTGPLVRELERS